ncbi:MAG: histidine phosphatase family protein [Cryomorphaceae bacterium]
MRWRSSLLAVFILTALWSCQTDTQTIYLVRHAEKDLTDTTDNPALTEAGIARAQRLPGVVNTSDIDKIYSTKYRRNLNTVKPLADSLGIEIAIYEWYNWEPMLAEVRAAKKGAVLICGHGDNLLPMIEHLGATPPVDSLGKHEYDKIFKVRMNGDRADVKMLTY